LDAPTFSAVFLLILCGLPLFAAGLSGVVSDPSGLPVQGAAVKFACPAGEQTVNTDVRGRFHFATGGTGCEISVTVPNFAVYRKVLTAGTDSIAIRLQLSTLRDRITVSPDDRGDSSIPTPGLGTVSLSGDQLKLISDNTADLIQYAKLMAGISGGSDAIYVDGLPAHTLPPVDKIARIIVNADPFSAEYSDGDQTHIDIITKSGDRHFHIHFGGGALGAGGKSVLANGPAKSSSGNWSASGPIPYLPLTFTLQFGYSDAVTPLAVEASQPPVLYPGGVWTSNSVSAANRGGSGTLNLYFSPAETFHGHVSYFESRADSSNSGVGGLVLAAGGADTHFVSRDLSATVYKSWGSLLLRGGMTYSDISTTAQAGSSALQVSVAGEFVAGGAPMTVNNSQRTDWTGKIAIESDTPSPNWTAGIMFDHAGDAILQTPNPAGSLLFTSVSAYEDAIDGQDTGSYFLTSGNGSVRYANTTVAPFFQKQIVKRKNLLVTGGVRADYQGGYGVMLSPRVGLATQWHKFVFRSGGGLFARDLTDDVLVRILQNDALHLQQYFAQDVSFADYTSVPLSSATTIHSQLAPGLTRPREWMQRSSIERPLGKFSTGVEYTWTRDEHLLGSRRLWEGDGWTDFLESDRNAAKNRVHTQLSYRLKAQRFLAFYDWTRSRDDTDGPFSFPANQNDLRAEWARSSGIAPHSAGLTGILSLPAKITANVTESWHGTAPYNITTGLDPTGDGLFTDRGGLPRNSGNGPGYKSLSLFASRRIGTPLLPTRPRKRIYFRVGLQATNLLNDRNYISLGSVLGSQTFGQPLFALPGRTFRVWLTLD
jgi:hypothetical protein